MPKMILKLWFSCKIPKLSHFKINHLFIDTFVYTIYERREYRLTSYLTDTVYKNVCKYYKGEGEIEIEPATLDLSPWRVLLDNRRALIHFVNGTS